MPYILPQVQVFQEFSQLPNDVVANLNAFVVGANYQLFRYSETAEKALIGLGAYNADADTTYSYPNQPAGATVDVDYVDVIMEDVWAKYATVSASVSTPLVCVSPAERNKLRAAPRVGSASAAQEGLATITNGIGLDTGGYVVDSPSVPEAFYFTPQGGELAGAVSRLNARSGAWSADDATLAYVTDSEGQTGTVDILSTDNPLTSGTTIAGPYGIGLDIDSGSRTAGRLVYAANAVAGDVFEVDGTTYTFDTDVTIGADAEETINNLKEAIDTDIQAGTLTNVDEVIHVVASDELYIVGETAFTISTDVTDYTLDGATAGAFSSLRKPVVLKIQNTAGTAYFTVTADPDALPTLIDSAIDDQASLKVNVVDGSLDVAWTSGTQLVTLTVDIGSSTLAEVRAALVGSSDVAAVLDIGAIVGSTLATADLVSDETTAPVTLGFDTFMLPDAFRVEVLANDITWATANGTTHSAEFKSRGVKVGDRIKYAVVGTDAVTYTGSSRVVDIEADQLAPVVSAPTVAAGNSADADGDLLTPHTGLDIVIPGGDNQRDFDGAETKVYALSSDVSYFPGDYSAGLLGDTFTVTVTTGGAAGAASASVATASGNYSRINVPITQIHFDHVDSAEMAMIYIGQNLWLTLQAGSGETAEFQVGDTYTFSRAITAPWSAIPAAAVSTDGAYTGAVDTTYVLEVTRGGVFDRTVTTTEGLTSATRAVITYTGQPTDADLVVTGDQAFEFDDNASVTVGSTLVTIGADADASYTALATAINASGTAAYATVDTVAGTLTIRGDLTMADDVAVSLDNAALVAFDAKLTAQVDFDANEWLAGDVDDEYVVRCTRSGTLTTAQFTAESQRGDTSSLITFNGSGSAYAADVGNQGVSAYFTVSDNAIPFTVGDFWVVRVNGTRPRVSVTDTAGVDQSSTVTVNDGESFKLGLSGVNATFAGNTNVEGGFATTGGLVTGDLFYVSCAAASEGALQTLVLADDLPEAVTCGIELESTGLTTDGVSNFAPTLFNLDLFLVQATTSINSKREQSAPDFNWEADASGVVVNGALAVQDASWAESDGSLPYLPVESGNIFVQYRALLPTFSGAVQSLSDLGDVSTSLGTVHPDNPLAQGVFNALTNSGDQPVYFTAVASDDLAGFTGALDKAAKVNTVYGIAAMTLDTQILNAVEAHVAAMSGDQDKRWRIAFVGSELPVNAVVYDGTTHPQGANYTATVTDNPAVAGTQHTLVTFVSGDETVSTQDIVPGDSFRCNFTTDAWGDATYSEYVVAEVVSNTKLILANGPTAPINIAAKVEVHHTRTTAQIATAVASISAGWADRRMYHVFPNKLYTAGVAQTSEFGAAALVGLVSSLPPQQGLTNIEVDGFDDAPAVYSTFTRAQLNEMAASGTFILMQDTPGGEIYVRHQVSTAASDGNLNTTELSVVKNTDAISYYFVGVLSPYIGRYNVTEDLLDQIHTEVSSGINFLGSDYTAAGLLGPMIIRGDNSEIRTLEQHPTLKDHVLINIDIELPIPLNVIQLRLVV